LEKQYDNDPCGMLSSIILFNNPVQAVQTPAPPRQQRRGHDRTDVGSANVVPTEPGRARRRNEPFSPPEQRRRRR